MGQLHANAYRLGGQTASIGARKDDDCGSKAPKWAKQEHLAGREKNGKSSSNGEGAKLEEEEEQRVRRLSNMSHRNIQLLSLKPRGEKEAFAENLRERRRSSLINLILGAPSSGPRFSDDLCSLSSHLSECQFGIDFFPHANCRASGSSLRLASLEELELGLQQPQQPQSHANQPARGPPQSVVCQNPAGGQANPDERRHLPGAARGKQQRKPSLASIDLLGSFEQHDRTPARGALYRPPLEKSGASFLESVAQSQESADQQQQQQLAPPAGHEHSHKRRPRLNQSGRVLRRTASELSLYSDSSSLGQPGANLGASLGDLSIGSAASLRASEQQRPRSQESALSETKLIIILQVCLPFILAGFGNMGAGLVLDRAAQKRAFQRVPVFFVLLPPLVGLKGNIEMTLASRLSTLANLSLLESAEQKRRAYLSNLVLILSQAIGLSLFAALLAVGCELLMGSLSGSPFEIFKLASLVVLASALTSSLTLTLLSSLVMSLAIILAKLIQVNPDNLSTLIAALYGDVSFVFVYGLVAELMHSLNERDAWLAPTCLISVTLAAWPLLLYVAYRFKETHSIALSSIPPMLTSMLVSMASGAVLSLVVGRFKLIALYQPVVNGFGANLIAVQASRVSTWLWCSALRKFSISRGNNNNSVSNVNFPKKTLGSIATFSEPTEEKDKKNPDRGEGTRIEPAKLAKKVAKTLLWSFCNPSPNSVAARLLIVMLILAQTIYFFVIWLLSEPNHIVITLPFYSIYVALCVIQVFILLTLCEPLMIFLMNRNLDPDVFGISTLMALADLTGTLCLAAAFFVLASLGDVNATH